MLCLRLAKSQFFELSPIGLIFQKLFIFEASCSTFQVFHIFYPVSEFSIYTSAVLTLSFSFLEVNTIFKREDFKNK